MGNGLKRADGRVLLCVTCDVEDSTIESLEQIRQTCARHHAPVTWFVEPRLCFDPSALNLLWEYCRQGDEVGLHVEWRGSLVRGLSSIPAEQIRTELEEAIQMLKPQYALESFRGGGLSQTTAALEIVKERGFKYDSSVAYALDEPTGWYQGHDGVLPLSAYYPSPRGYNVVSHDGEERLDILEIPVTRGVPSSKLWHNMLEPDITPLSIMKLVFHQYHLRRRFQPLVLMVVIFHSYSPRRNGDMIRTLDRFLSYASSHNVEFGTIAMAGEQWKATWERQPPARETLLWHRFSSDPRTWFLVGSIKLVILAHNLIRDPAYYPKRLISMCQHGNQNVGHDREGRAEDKRSA
jgi:hypothetical protein